ncbi:CRM-domain containing factor CFM3A, chloroplastic/mitochondrial [Cucumis sativus]|uniref:CRM domain-containing protein n=1 Tax=Cucumis sativus TaxID=3659 RepID=A0A0A0L8G4_CUCSA|nr:CRM-domain containing factor CFM3A, chloroplastic/mitochondrial [Cucumis sativus]KGN56912.1 hypothetical protein Csa_010639 [Cucumis sativus]
MALLHSRLCHATNFFDTFQTEFHSSHILLKYGSSVVFRNRSFCSSFYGLTTDTFSNGISYGSLSSRTPVYRYNLRRNLSRVSWIDRWNETAKRNRPKPPRAVLDYPSSDENEVSISSTGFSKSYRASSRIDDDGRGGSTMEKIVRKLKKFGYIDDENKEKGEERAIEKGSVEDILYIEEGMLPNTRGGFSKESPMGDENMFGSDGEVRFPWEKPKEKEDTHGDSTRRGSASLAQLTLPEPELRRLRNLTFQKRHKMKIGGGGVTQAVVDVIHEKWKSSEIVRLKILGPPALNMKRMHEILERKTGGLVIWRSGTSLSLYRGVSYELPEAPQFNKRIYKRNEITALPKTGASTIAPSESSSHRNVYALQQKRAETSIEGEHCSEQLTKVQVNYEDEVNKLLDGLGPRYTDWPGLDPLPVDADMLPGVVPDYEPPFRILPYGVRSSIGVKEATALKRLARRLPPHFALGRNRQLQGLAIAMTKLWERSLIAKIALKRGVQLTTSERMAEEIKKLTGGMLLSRNKDFLVFYRGKSFLSPEVTEALLERERLAKSLQDKEEQARLKASAFVVPIEKTEQSGTAGSLEETLDADARWGKALDDKHKENVMREAEQLRHTDLVRKLERKLAFAERKLVKAERTLAKVEAFMTPAKRQAEPDSITEEERFMFRKLGLRMKAFLLLGRREVFDGTVENMHLHWKYRELVKIMIKANSFDHVKNIALQLEAESGGVLVSIDKVSKGYAIIVYRGKDYKRPSLLRPKNLLTKRKALARSIELQRHEALLKHISAMQSKVGKLNSEIEQMEKVKDQGDEVLYNTLDSAYPTDNDSEDENSDTYEAYDQDSDVEDEDDIMASDEYLEGDISNGIQVQESEVEYETI